MKHNPRNDFNFRSPQKDFFSETVMKRTGMPPAENIDNPLRNQFINIASQISDIANPKIDYLIKPITSIETNHIAADDFIIMSKMLTALTSQSNNPGWICCFALTLGSSVDDWINLLQKNSLLEAFIADTAGSELIEFYAGQFESFITKTPDCKDMEISARFSPGYCDWDLLQGQNAIFNLLKPEKIGMEKISSGLIIPQKSITGIIIAATHISHRTPCSICSKTECPFRRII